MKHVIKHFKKIDPILFDELERIIKFEGLENLAVKQNADGLFTSLCWSIVNQQLSKKAAETIFGRFKLLFKNKKVEPKQLSKFKIEQLRKVGISYQKVSYLQDLAKKVLDKEVELEKFKKMKDEQIIDALIKVKGIGKWTAEMFLMFALGREDVFSYGDLILRTRVEQLYFKNKKPTIEQVGKITIKWSPYRTYASRILWIGNRIKD